MIGAHEAVDVVGCRKLWVAVLAAQWDISFGMVRATPLEAHQGKHWFGSADFYEICAFVGFDGGAVLDRWKRQQALFAAGHTDFAPAMFSSNHQRMKPAAKSEAAA